VKLSVVIENQLRDSGIVSHGVELFSNIILHEKFVELSFWHQLEKSHGADK
jgi:hypothetical protein